jgi:hypothetical protein
MDVMKYLLAAALLTFFFLSACQPANLSSSEGDQEPATTSMPDGEESLNIQGFMDALSLTGVAVGEEGTIEQPFFSVPGQVITVNGEAVQVFEYSAAAQADAEASQVAPDGSSVGTTMATWVGPPHFFQSERLIVLYVGEDDTVLESLETVLGPQFAGADSAQESSSLTEPIPAIMQISDEQQISGVGSYCWTAPGAEVGICADTIGIPTSPEPIAVESPFVARFINPLSTPLDSLTLSVTPLEQEDKLSEEPMGLYWWRPDSGDQINKHLSPPHEVELSLEPGLYLLNFFAKWQEFGDVSYGFLVEVLPN